MVGSVSKGWKIFAFALLLGIVKGEPSKILSTMVKLIFRVWLFERSLSLTDIKLRRGYEALYL